MALQDPRQGWEENLNDGDSIYVNGNHCIF